LEFWKYPFYICAVNYRKVFTPNHENSANAESLHLLIVFYLKILANRKV